MHQIPMKDPHQVLQSKMKASTCSKQMNAEPWCTSVLSIHPIYSAFTARNQMSASPAPPLSPLKPFGIPRSPHEKPASHLTSSAIFPWEIVQTPKHPTYPIPVPEQLRCHSRACNLTTEILIEFSVLEEAPVKNLPVTDSYTSGRTLLPHHKGCPKSSSPEVLSLKLQFAGWRWWLLPFWVYYSLEIMSATTLGG